MKLNKLRSLIAGSFVAVLLLAGTGLSTANAQARRGGFGGGFGGGFAGGAMAGFHGGYTGGGYYHGGHGPGRVVVVRPFGSYWYPGYYNPLWSPYYYGSDPLALQQERGYRDGLDEGRDDAKHGLAADATENKDYLKSNSMAFRDAFVQGYDEGYRERLDDVN